MAEFYRSSFPRLTAALYTGGAAFHFMRVVTGFSPTDIPYFIDWVIALIGLYGGLGFLVFFRELSPQSRWRQVLSGIMVFHLLGSTMLHAYILATRSHSVLGVFPLAYSAGAILAFLGFAWVAGTTRLGLVTAASRYESLE
jgi:hypothetical protein